MTTATAERAAIITSNGQEPIVFSVTEATIKPMADRYMKLVVNGIDDKVGLEVCHKARMDCVKARTTCEREHKRVKEDALKECQRIDKSKRDILALIAPIERHLEQQEDAVAKEVARIAQAKLDTMVNSRLAILSDAGESSLSRDQLGTINDDAFALEVIRAAEATRVRKESQEAARIERELMAAEREALDRERREHDAEVARLKKIEDDRLAAAQADLDRQIHEIAVEHKRLADEAERKRSAEDRERIKREVSEQTRIATEQLIAREAEEAAAKAARVEFERLRQEALRPDREKLAQVAVWLERLQMPDVSPESFDLRKAVNAVIYRAASEIREILEAA